MAVSHVALIESTGARMRKRQARNAIRAKRAAARQPSMVLIVCKLYARIVAMWFIGLFDLHFKGRFAWSGE
jgi:hypothetical protein